MKANQRRRGDQCHRVAGVKPVAALRLFLSRETAFTVLCKTPLGFCPIVIGSVGRRRCRRSSHSETAFTVSTQTAERRFVLLLQESSGGVVVSRRSSVTK